MDVNRNNIRVTIANSEEWLVDLKRFRGASRHNVMQTVRKKYIKTQKKVTNKHILSLTCCICFIFSHAVAQTNVSIDNKYIPDTTLNLVLKLFDPASIRNAIGSQSGKMIVDEGPTRVQLTNKSGKEYLILYHSDGSNINSFGEFEVGWTRSTGKSFRSTRFVTFFTESGIRLGMAMDSLIALKGKNFLRSSSDGQIVLTYNIEENLKDGNVELLKRYNMPKYQAEYYFINSKLVKFIFGFPAP